MLTSLLLAAATAGPGEASLLDKLPHEISVKNWINTKGWKGLADLNGKVVLLEFWATW